MIESVLPYHLVLDSLRIEIDSIISSFYLIKEQVFDLKVILVKPYFQRLRLQDVLRAVCSNPATFCFQVEQVKDGLIVNLIHRYKE